MYFNFILYLCNELLLLFCSLPIVKNVPKRVKILFFRIARVICLLILSKVALALGLLFMDELSQAVAPFLPSSSSAGGLNQPPAPSGDSAFFPISQSDEGEEQPAGTSEIEKAKAKRESLNRFPKPHPRNIAFENALIRQDHIMEKMANIIKVLQSHLEDPLDIKRGVDLFLRDIMQMESRTRSTQLRKILTSLSDHGAQSPFYAELLAQINSFRGE